MAVLVIIMLVLIIAALAFLIFSVKASGTAKKQAVVTQEKPSSPDEDTSNEEKAEEEETELVNLFDVFGEEGDANAEKGGTTEVKEEERSYDKLTDLMDNRNFLSEGAKILEVAKQNDSRYAVAYFDIDRFRFINSIKGYSLGDFVLTKLSQEIRAIFPDGSQFARISADHFSILFPANDDTLFESYCDHIKKSCEKIRVDMGIKGSIRICIGIAVTEQAGNPMGYNISVLQRKANIARHCLKASKAESYSIYDETMITSNLYGESLLEDYTENQYGDDFVIRFQSITDLNRKHIVGCDPLVRWACQADSNAEPLSVENGRIPTNITKIIYHTCRAASRWRKMEKEVVPLYINVTETEFFCADLDEFIAKCLSEFQLEPDLVHIVVDVSVVRIDWTIANRQIKRLRDTGLKVGVSGIGISTISLDFLGGLPLSFIKPNYTFTVGMNKSPEKIDAIRALIVMAQAQNLRLIFEGVNSIEQMQEHIKLGSGLVEGRSGGPPMLADEFAKMLDDASATTKAANSTVILDEKAFSKGDYNL